MAARASPQTIRQIVSTISFHPSASAVVLSRKRKHCRRTGTLTISAVGSGDCSILNGILLHSPMAVRIVVVLAHLFRLRLRIRKTRRALWRR